MTSWTYFRKTSTTLSKARMQAGEILTQPVHVHEVNISPNPPPEPLTITSHDAPPDGLFKFLIEAVLPPGYRVTLEIHHKIK